MLPLLTGQVGESTRHRIFQDYDLTAMRYDDWKLIFMEQQATGTFRVWTEPFVPQRLPLIENLRVTLTSGQRSHPTSVTSDYWTLPSSWRRHRPIWAYFLPTLKDNPPPRKTASVNLDRVMEKKQSGSTH
jgi:arylsulfatase